ncbi:MAG: ferredoxin [Nocardioides sp.]|jgi:ferredoxin|nr:ferredoxin [Nocardioides sp.]
MRIHADIGKCQGYGNCVAIDAKHFDLDDDGMVVVLDDAVAPDELDTTEEAVRSCPVSAIWTQAAGGPADE